MIREGKADYCHRCNRMNTKKVGWDQTYCTYCGEKIYWTDNAQKRQVLIIIIHCSCYHFVKEDIMYLEPLKQSKPPKQELPTTRKIGWDCTLCTFKNLPYRPGCEICGTARPAGYVPPPDYVPVGEDRRYIDKDEYDKQQILMVIPVALLFCNEFFISKFLENEHKEQKEVAQRNYRDLLNADAIPAVVNEDVFKCPVCNGYINPGEGIRLRSCLHMICK